MNKDSRPHVFRVALETGDDEGGNRHRLDPSEPTFTVPSGEVFNAAVRVRRNAWNDAVDPTDLDDTDDEAGVGTAEIHFVITAIDDPALTARAESRFFSPRE